ncbi:MAG: hypothetical protein ACFFG0_02120 [Candidatus Thorarchaeota archaeon]
MLPEIGSSEYEEMINFMRKDVESGMRLSKMIQSVKERFKKEGRDFTQEFENWKRENKLC